jgi:hypothetical protein
LLTQKIFFRASKLADAKNVFLYVMLIKLFVIIYYYWF